MRTRHLNIRPYVCEQCGAAYAAETELRRHVRRHGDDKQYKCELCNYASHDKGNLQSEYEYERGTICAHVPDD